MAATGLASTTTRSVRRVYLGTSCLRRIFITPLIAILHADGSGFVRLLTHSRFSPAFFLAEYYGLARENYGGDQGSAEP